jgi:hypothetical protein
MAARDDCDNSRMVVVDQHPNPCINTNSPPPSTTVTVKLNFSAGWAGPSLVYFVLVRLLCRRGRATQNVPYRLVISTPTIYSVPAREDLRRPAKERYNNSLLLPAPLVPQVSGVSKGISRFPSQLVVGGGGGGGVSAAEWR